MPASRPRWSHLTLNGIKTSQNSPELHHKHHFRGDQDRNSPEEKAKVESDVVVPGRWDTNGFAVVRQGIYDAAEGLAGSTNIQVAFGRPYITRGEVTETEESRGDNQG